MEEVQRLWAYFLHPSPWNILTTGCISSEIWFQQAFCNYVFPVWHRKRWRDRGLFSGVTRRLFQTMDTNGSMRITFEEYLAGIYVFTRANPGHRFALCFRFCDFDCDGKVSRQDLTQAFQMLHEMYCGRSTSKDPELICQMIFDRARFSKC